MSLFKSRKKMIDMDELYHNEFREIIDWHYFHEKKPFSFIPYMYEIRPRVREYWRSFKNNHTTNIHEIVKEDYINKYNSKHNFPDKFLNKMTDYAIYKYWNEKFRPNDIDEYKNTILKPLQNHRKSVKNILNEEEIKAREKEKKAATATRRQLEGSSLVPIRYNSKVLAEFITGSGKKKKTKKNKKDQNTKRQKPK